MGLSDIDVVEVFKAIIQLLQVLAPISVSLFGIWKIVIAYQDRRATAREQENARAMAAKEREHSMAMELQAANAARAAAADEREDTQLQKAIEGITMLAQEVGKMSSNQAKLIDVMQESQKQEAQRTVEAEKSNANFFNISEQMKQYVRGVSELSGNLVDSIGSVAGENRRYYQEALDKKVAEQSKEAAALIAELKAKLEKLESYVEKEILPTLKDIHTTINILTTKAADVTAVNQVVSKLDTLETELVSLILQKSNTDTPATPPASAVVDGATAPKPNEAQPASKQETKP